MPPGTERTAHAQGRVPGLDGLRGVAIALVLLAHVLGFNGAGLTGVLVFFVLSGYLITWLLLVELDASGRISLAAFYLRRALRLGPALLVFLVLFLAAASLLDIGVTGREAVTGTALALTYLTDFAFAFEVGYVPELAHLWSLAVEEQFYLLWPLALIALCRVAPAARRVALLWKVIAVAWVVRVGTVVASWLGGVYFYPLPTTWADLLLLGAMGALLRRDRPDLMARVVTVVSRPSVLVAALMVIAGFSLAPGSYLWPATYLVGMPLLGAATIAILLAVVLGPPRRITRFLSTRPLRALGTISYGLYLYNSACIMILQETLGRGLGMRAVGAVLAVGLATLSYRCVERPALALKRRWSRTGTSGRPQAGRARA
ncbi:MAG: acyltransferase [Terracoccus sp.]